MSSALTSKPVCVTGATGFIASRIIEQLLERGYAVRGTVRSLAKTKDHDHLRAFSGAAQRLSLVEAELTQAGAFDAAVADCEYVMHTASPYSLDTKDPQKDLVIPALEGTRNVLASCKKAGSVKKVVLTSSMAAITDEPESDHVLTENDWNEKSSLERNPYYYSKAAAEREAWRIVKEEKPGYELVAINPFLVIGPSVSPGLNASNQLFVDLLKGTYPGIMSITWGFVDVRDVALAHVLAMENEKASGRYICANETMSMRALVEVLASKGYAEGYKLPKLGMDCSIGDFAVKLSSYLQPRGVGQYLRTHVGRTPRYDNGKIQRELGLKFTPLEQSISDVMKDLERWGHLPPRSGS